jgi:hypothetical protein
MEFRCYRVLGINYNKFGGGYIYNFVCDAVLLSLIL